MKKLIMITDYNKNPKLCKYCKSQLPFDKRHENKFCSKSCAAIFNNGQKDWSKITTGPRPKPNKSKQSTAPTITDPYTKIYLCVCKISGEKWYSPTVKSIHPSIIHTKKLYTYQCRFQFSIRNYPEWFSDSIDLLTEYGWYSAANRGNNLSGCSRDHLYSVSDGFINGVDPLILAHPANCKIVPHRTNQSKHKKSSITLEELLKRIEDFNTKYVES